MRQAVLEAVPPGVFGVWRVELAPRCAKHAILHHDIERLINHNLLFVDAPPYTQLKELVREQLAPGDLVNRAGKPLVREILGHLPALQATATTLLDDFQTGQLAFQVIANSLDQRLNVLRAALKLSVRRVVVSVLLVGLLLGSTLTLLIPLEGRVGEFESPAIRRITEVGFAPGALFIIVMLLSSL